MGLYNGPGDNYDYAYDVGISPDGARVFVTGWSEGLNGTEDFATVAYAVDDGRELWVSRHDGPAGRADGAYALAVAPDGDRVYVTGTELRSDSRRDVSTIAYDASTGTQLWVKRIEATGGEVGNRASDVAVSPDGSTVYVTGIMYVGPGHFDSDMFVVAYDAHTGAQTWMALYDGPAGGYDTGVGLATSAGRVFAIGQSDGGDSSYDFATIAYDAGNGDQVWVSRYAGPGSAYDVPAGLAVSADGDALFVTGESHGGPTGPDYATVAYGALDGEELWASRFDHLGSDQRGRDVPSAIVVHEAQVIVAGSSEGSSQNHDFAIIAYDATSGVAEWKTRSDYGEADFVRAMALSPDGTQVFVTGSTTGGRA